MLTLTAVGHDIIFDSSLLDPGDDYKEKIRDAIEQAEGMIFLISPGGVQKVSYALTELKFARDKWSHPKEYVLPVMLQPTSLDDIPRYLKDVTILTPEGNAAAETADAARDWSSAVVGDAS